MPSVTLRLLPGKRSFPRFDSGGRPMPGLEPDKEYVIEADTEAALWHKLLPYYHHCELVEGVLPQQPKPQSASLGRYVKAALDPQAPEQKPQLATLFTCPHCATQPFSSAPGLARHLMRAHPSEYQGKPEYAHLNLDPFALNDKGIPSNDLTPWLALVEGTVPPAEEEETDETEEVVGDLPEAGSPLREAIINAFGALVEARKKGIVAAVVEATEADANEVDAEFDAMLNDGILESAGRWDYRIKQ